MYDPRVAFIVGTRPEAIKLSPIAKALVGRGIVPRILLTGQHPNLDPAAFGMSGFPRIELGCVGQSDPHAHVAQVTRRVRSAVEGAALIVVQGDTSSALGGALGANLAGVPVAHVEAGLRSHDRMNPWPEEDFRIAIDGISDLLFAPTQLSAANLRREGASGCIVVTGNTGIDTLLEQISEIPRPVRTNRRRLLVTCHRRESWGEGLHAIGDCLRQIAMRPDVMITLVLHPNPAVASEMRRLIGDCPRIVLRDPCTHIEMLHLMRSSDLILSDSGGVQEEAPALGIPLLVLRERTERPEGVLSGNTIIVGRSPETVPATVHRLLSDAAALAAMAKPALPYGDGRAGIRISAVIAERIANAARHEASREPHNIGKCQQAS